MKNQKRQMESLVSAELKERYTKLRDRIDEDKEGKYIRTIVLVHSATWINTLRHENLTRYHTFLITFFRSSPQNGLEAGEGVAASRTEKPGTEVAK